MSDVSCDGELFPPDGPSPLNSASLVDQTSAATQIDGLSLPDRKSNLPALCRQERALPC